MALALVTGGNRGIGLEVARELGRDGMRILLGSRDRQRGEAAVATLRGEGLDITPLELDVADPAAAASVGPAIEVLSDQHDELIDMLGSLDRLGEVGTRVIHASKEDVLSMLDDLEPILSRWRHLPLILSLRKITQDERWLYYLWERFEQLMKRHPLPSPIARHSVLREAKP